MPLFDGKTLDQWEGDPKLWRVQDGCLTGGSLTEGVTHNDFLATKKDYSHFIVRLKIKLTGTEGFINSGFQIRSQRVPNNSEMAGYQCDYGEPNWYGCVYDESRRNKVVGELTLDGRLMVRPGVEVQSVKPASTAGYRYTVVNNHTVLVDPETRRIVEVID